MILDNHKKYKQFNLFSALFILTAANLIGQQIVGLSSGYDVFPYSRLVDMPAGSEKMEIQTSSHRFGAAFPLMFGNGKYLVMNQFNYRRVSFQYKNQPELLSTIGSDLDRAISVNYTMFMLDSLSEKWTMVFALTPGLASDFKADNRTNDDFTLQVIFGFMKNYGKNLQVGYGLAYMRDFGRPLPLPFIYFEWNNGDRLSAQGLVPTDVTVSWKMNPMIDLMLAFKIVGDRHHGDPDIFGVKNPQLEYSEGTLSPSVNIHLKQWLHLNLESGYAAYRNMEFLDSDESASSYDLEKTVYFRMGIVLGI